MRPLRASDYLAWKLAHEAAEPKKNDFDSDKKTTQELSIIEFKKFLRKNKEFLKQNQIYYYGVFEKKTGRLVGHVLFALILRFNVQSARISYYIFNNFWKHGFGSEVVMAAIQFAFKKLKLHRIEAEVLPSNKASIALLKKLGMQCEGIRRSSVYFHYKWHDHIIYSMIPSDLGWKNSRPTILR